MWALLRMCDLNSAPITPVFAKTVKSFITIFSQGRLEEPPRLVLPRCLDRPGDHPPRPVPVAVLHAGVLDAVRGGAVKDVPQGHPNVKEGEDAQRGKEE